MTVDIYKVVYEKISQRAKEAGVSTKDLVNTILEEYLHTLDFMSKTFSHLSIIGGTDTSILVEDRKKNDAAKLTLEKGNPYCSLCESNYCEHITFSICSPHWDRILANITQS